MPETLEFISLVPWTSIAMILNVYILYRIVRRLLFRPVQEIFNKRQQELDKLYGDAAEKEVQASEAKKQYEEQLLHAHEEAESILLKATDSAKKREIEITEMANKKVQKQYERAEAEIEQLHRKATIELKNDISEMAVDIARKIVKKEISKEDHDRLIEDCIQQLREDTV